MPTESTGANRAPASQGGDRSPVIAVTGARGFLGSRVCEHLERSGARVVELTRAPNERSQSDREQRRFRLSESPGVDLLSGVNLLIHCAYDFGPRTWTEIRAVNVEGSRRLFEAAEAAGVARIVTVSSMSAFDGCRSMYGRAKLDVERETFAHGGVVVRPGLIFGQDAGGMVGSLVQVIRSGGLVPVIRSSSKLYAVHVADLVRLIERLADPDSPAPPTPIVAAHSRAFTLSGVFAVLAGATHERVRRVPVPWWLVWTGLKAVEAVGLTPGFRSDSVVSLVHQNPHPDFGPTEASGIDFRPFDPETALVD
jgi:nucleoside-diphosphate-sugar epimerase